MSKESGRYIMKKEKQSIQAEKWIEQYYTSIYRYCYFKTSNRTIAQDLTQDTFCRFFQRFEAYKREEKIKQILFTIAHNLCVDYFRKMSIQKEQLYIETMDTSNVQDPERSLTLQKILNELPSDIRDTLLLYFYYGCKLKEIATIMNTSTSNVKYRMAKGKTAVKQAVKKEGMSYEEWF